MHIGIAGAGLLGRLLALKLSLAGHRVEVFDLAQSSEPRAATTALAAAWSAAGMLRPVAEMDRGNQSVLDWALRSLEAWPNLLKNLSTPVFHRMNGTLFLAHRQDVKAAKALIDMMASRVPEEYRPIIISRERLREMEPCIAYPAYAWLMPQAGCLDNESAMQAFYLEASRYGAQWHWGVDVGHVLPHCLQYQMCEGEDSIGTIHKKFDHVFDVRGVGAKPDLTAPEVRGVRGEIFLLEAKNIELQRPIFQAHPRHSVYITPRANGHLLVGASEIESEDRSPVSVRSTLELLSSAYSVMPELAEARVVRLEVNLRPAMPDNFPILMTQKGLTRINGLYRHGWMIAPAMVDDALKTMQEEQ